MDMSTVLILLFLVGLVVIGFGLMVLSFIYDDDWKQPTMTLFAGTMAVGIGLGTMGIIFMALRIDSQIREMGYHVPSVNAYLKMSALSTTDFIDSEVVRNKFEKWEANGKK